MRTKSVSGWSAMRTGSGVATVALAGAALVAFPGSAGAAGLPDNCTAYTPPDAVTTVRCEFGFTGEVQTFQVPDGVTELDVKAVGGQGGSSGLHESGGLGARVMGEVTVEPAVEVYVYVGGDGRSYEDGMPGGFNGGADSGSYGTGGGGASDVRTSEGDLASRLIVAAGGGGAGYLADGGDAGAAGADGSARDVWGTGGGAGTPTAGGKGGNSSSSSEIDGDDGRLGAGGTGGFDSGGGGGGLFGGGGGGSWAGGGGGSSLVPEGGTVTIVDDEDEGPSVTISYTIDDSGENWFVGSIENLFGSLS